jgi:hypothetical protein
MNVAAPRSRRGAALAFVEGLIPPVQPHHELGTTLTSPFIMSLDDIGRRFAFTPRRERLFEGLKLYIKEVRALETPPVAQIIAGSFVDEVPDPGDIDVLSILEGLDEEAFPLFCNKQFVTAVFGVDPFPLMLRGNTAEDCLALARAMAYYSCRRDGRARAMIWLV